MLLHTSYVVPEEDRLVVRACKIKGCNCSTEACPNAARKLECPKHWKRGCKNQNFRRNIRKLRDDLVCKDRTITHWQIQLAAKDDKLEEWRRRALAVEAEVAEWEVWWEVEGEAEDGGFERARILEISFLHRSNKKREHRKVCQSQLQTKYGGHHFKGKPKTNEPNNVLLKLS
ncbi:hypothetical protein CRE_22233 [Caenorhabditis remanei]|uniref:Uncharacterized protein n=1 Tax=Caenorhabditis remanei TaxID=31234 RepID=E3NRN6_CAERE|nr:hypothetical protein CRE_22233 [Caenorhabditis remanei]